MSNIEDDVKILKEFNSLKVNSPFRFVEISYPRLQKAIYNILSDYTRQKQINEEHKKLNGELREKVKKLEEENRMFKNNKVLVSRYFKLKDNSIPKQKIEDKIEELKEENYQISLESKVVFDTGIMKNNLKIQVLQELLQESEDK